MPKLFMKWSSAPLLSFRIYGSWKWLSFDVFLLEMKHAKMISRSWKLYSINVCLWKIASWRTWVGTRVVLQTLVYCKISANVVFIRSPQKKPLISQEIMKRQKPYKCPLRAIDARSCKIMCKDKSQIKAKTGSPNLF